MSTKLKMDNFYDLRTELREKFIAIVKSSASEERFIEFISPVLSKSNKLDAKALEVILDLTLAVVDPSGYIIYNYCDSKNDTKLEENDFKVPDSSSYDADDEDLDEKFIFPCHTTFDDCHPELLFDYHRENLKFSKSSTQIVKHPRICEFVIDFAFKRLKNHILTLVSRELILSPNRTRSPDPSIRDDLELTNYISSIVALIRRLASVCTNEKKNCIILSRTDILNILMKNILFLIQELPDKQYIYLDPLLKFALTLADYKLTGTNLKQLFNIIKNQNTSLQIVLENLEGLLSHHIKLLRNIQPLRSINFPTASKTAEEIEYDLYVANSWHWRLRNKVTEFKRKRSRTSSQSTDFKTNHQLKKNINNEQEENGENQKPSIQEDASSLVMNQITPSWLECSMITPLSNVSPLIQDGKIRFCCSLWMSICGDLLVVDGNEVKKTKGNDRFKADITNLHGHWLRLTSRRRSVRRYKDKTMTQWLKSRRLSAKLQIRQARDKEDEERDEIDEKAKRYNAELNQTNYGGRKFKLFHSTLNRTANSDAKIKPQEDNLKKITISDSDPNDKMHSKEFNRKARDNSQELLIHIVSFAMDSLTIEIWLNVKYMTFCARACRVARAGQTSLLDQVTFPSHLEANGSWSNVMFCLKERDKAHNSDEIVMNLKVYVNQIHKEEKELVYGVSKNSITNFALLIGCERSTFGYVWKLSQINIYKNIPDDNTRIYLLGKGPDFWSFTNFRQQSTLPLPDIVQRSVKNMLEPKILKAYSAIDEDQALNWLTQNIVISYVAHKAEHFLDYSLSMKASSLVNPLPADYEFSNSAERFIQAKTLNFSRTMKFNYNHGFGSALVEAGGIESVLICFAEVIRRTNEMAECHSLAFSILLKMSQTNLYHLNKFLDELNGLKMVEFILSHPRCVISKPVIKNYLELCLVKKGEHSLIKSPKLIHHLLNCWRAWHKDVKIARYLYKRLIRLLQLSDPPPKSKERRYLEICYINHNFRMMTNAGGMDILMSVLRECLVPHDDNVPNINHELVELIVNLILLLNKSPPGLDVMLDTMEFLLLLHPDPKAYVEVTVDKTSFLHTIRNEDREMEMVFDGTLIGPRTLSSDTAQSFQSSMDNIDDTKDLGSSSDSNLNEMRNTNSQSTFRSSSDDKLFRCMQNRVSQQCSDNLAKFIKEYKVDSIFKMTNLMDDKLLWAHDKLVAHNKPLAASHGSKVNELGDDCSNRNFAIAIIADMLASIVESNMTSTDVMNVLSEALQKPIIDIRKLVILANNNTTLVRERVLRLFLFCIRKCHLLNLQSILNRCEQDSKNTNFKICIPMQLMARQLLKYPTTIKMIHLCYGIILETDHFDKTIEPKYLVPNIKTIVNHLQMDTLILLIQLLTQLQSPEDIAATLGFVHAYVKQLSLFGQENTVLALIKYNLIDCMMKLYFVCVENQILQARQSVSQQNRFDKEKNMIINYLQVEGELDQLLVFVVRHYMENQPTNETIKSIDDLLLYFDLLNSHLPPNYQHILRERKVKILSIVLKYCKHYEQCAKKRVYSGKVEYYLKSFFKNNDLNRFSNVLSDTESSRILNDHSDQETTSNDSKASDYTNAHHNTSTSEEYHAGLNGFDTHSDLGSTDNGPHSNNQYGQVDTKDISEASVIDRFKAAFDFIVNFIATREPKVIPSPLEREFIIKFIKLLSRYLSECQQSATIMRSFSAKQKSHWSIMLQKLERSIRCSFSRLILYLLSPCEAMNLDERKYYVHRLLKMFTVDQLLNFLDDNSGKTTYKVLIVFLRHLIDSDDGASDSDDVSFDDTESKLKQLMRGIELELGMAEHTRSNGHLDQSNKKARLSGSGLSNFDTKLRAIWLADLAQLREDARERLVALKTGNQLTNATSTEDLLNSADKLLDEAVNITRDVVNDKHEQRKAYLEDVKQGKIYNYHIRQQWLSLIIGHTHERAIWYMEKYYPKSWELNPVEGPSRTRRRLRPCKLTLEPRFIRHRGSERGIQVLTSYQGENGQDDAMPSCSNNSTVQLSQSGSQCNLFADDWYNQYSPHPLCSLVINNEQSMDSNELKIRMFTTDRIHFNCDCSIIRPNEVCEGEVSIASWCIHFIGERSDNYQRHLSDCISMNKSPRSKIVDRLTNQYRLDGKTSSASATSEPVSQSLLKTINTSINSRRAYVSTIVEDLWFDEIVEIWDRRYQLRDVGLEVFLTNNMTYLMSFRSNRDREDFKQHLMREQHKMINLQRFNLNTSLNRLTQLWRDGKLTNFDYLTCLNKLAGRSFNDLMQYPVFPFVLSNYTSETLDLNSIDNFRKLKRPMAIQNEDREANFINNYQISQTPSLTEGTCGMTKPYHYGNHYSNSATVLHFLVRLPPFTQMLIQYQDNNFDQPDRTFHSISNTWQLITRDSNTDFKELIPEFFFLPEMFINIENLQLGRKQNNELVDDVKLPLWCPNSDARLFTLIHRQALESPHVSENLHHWIDLIFGYKQTGKAAVEAINVFHPATYYGEIDLNGQQGSSNSSSFINSITILPKPSAFCSDYMPSADLPRNQSSISGFTNSYISPSKKTTLSKRQQADLERSALETMINTYGQMPKQLFTQPMKQRSFSTSVCQVIDSRSSEKQQHVLEAGKKVKKLEPLKKVKGLRWGSFVGSPDDGEIIAVKHRRIVPEESNQTKHGRRNLRSKSSNKQIDKFHFCLLANGDIAILKDNTSLMLDYRADRKSSGTYQLSIPSARFSRRAGLSSVARMNLFSNMIISRQQFSFLEPIYSSASQLDSLNTATSTVVSFTGSRTKFSPESLSLVSWFYLDGTIRIKHPATNNQKPSIPLVQASTIVDTMSTCCSVPELNLLLVGYNSGSICAHIISTSYETVSLAQCNSLNGVTSATLSSSSGAPSSAHFLHTTLASSSTDIVSLGGGEIGEDSLSGEPVTVLSLSGKTLQSVRSMNRTSRWLYCHSKKINCIKISVGFGIVVTGSDDGTSVIWDLNSLTYVRTIDYKFGSLRKRGDAMECNQDSDFYWTYGRANKQRVLDYLCNRSSGDNTHSKLASSRGCDNGEVYPTSPDVCKCCICSSGVSLIAISDTLGDIVTVKDINNRLAGSGDLENCKDQTTSIHSISASTSTESESSLTSVVYVHTINGALVGFVNCHTRVTAVCYSNAPEGISVNVIVVGMSDGLVRLYSSWDLSRVKELRVSGLSSPISSLLYTRDSQLLYIAYDDGQLVVLRNKKKGAISTPKEWYL